jgi:3-phenylpropionate/cinnamic acid dioxygenase small subunit
MRTLAAERLLYLDLLREVEELLYAEAELLDERRYDEWLALFTDDVRYWMPLRKNVEWARRDADASGEDEVGWIDDDKATLEKRVKQLQTGIHWAEEPISRVSHAVTNIRFTEHIDSLTEAQSMGVKSHFIVYRNRLERETDLLVGRREDTLRRVEGRLRIARRKILIEQSVLMAKNLTVFL